MEYTNKIKELVERPIIRDDFDEEWMNKMTDEELDQFEKESFEMCLEKGSTEQYSDETHSEEIITKWVANYIDRGILYELFKERKNNEKNENRRID